MTTAGKTEILNILDKNERTLKAERGSIVGKIKELDLRMKHLQEDLEKIDTQLEDIAASRHYLNE